MLHFLTLPHKKGPAARFFREWAKELQSRVRVLGYDEIGRAADLPDATYLFADVDRLSPDEEARAQAVWDSLAERGSRVQLLNRPGKCLRRYDLLRKLYGEGRNTFNVFRPSEIGPDLRFPVFIRLAERHNGALTPLLHDGASLQGALRRQRSAGHDPDDLLVVEFQDTAAAGIYRKFGAMKIGETIVPHHVMFRSDWLVKHTMNELLTPEMIEEESLFQSHFPHRGEVTEIFGLASIDFGRIDYALHEGRIQAWEINTNPVLLPSPQSFSADRLASKVRCAAALAAALVALDRKRRPPTVIERLKNRIRSPGTS